MTEIHKYIFRDNKGNQVGGEWDNIVTARENAFYKKLELVKRIYVAVDEQSIKDYRRK